MSESDKLEYIEEHLYQELYLLLVATDFWKFLRSRESGIIVNMARDSVCVHFRTLHAFFTNGYTDKDISIVDFGIAKSYKSKCSKWLGKINEAVLHISPSRANTKNTPFEDLNEQMEIFKDEIVLLWKRFISESDKYKEVLEDCLTRAQNEASMCIQNSKL